MGTSLFFDAFTYDWLTWVRIMLITSKMQSVTVGERNIFFVCTRISFTFSFGGNVIFFMAVPHYDLFFTLHYMMSEYEGMTLNI